MSNIQFWRSNQMSDDSFLDLVKRTFGKTFTKGIDAKNWLITNGYYTSYPDIVTDGLVLYLDAPNLSSFKGAPTTNLLQHSENFNNPYWVKQNGIEITSVTTIIDPNGGNNTFKLNKTGGGQYLYQPVSVAAAGTYSISVWARTISGTVQFTQGFYNGNSFSGSIIHNVTTTWQRFTDIITFTGGWGSWYPCVIYPDSSTSGTILIYGAQLESKTYTTPYIKSEESLGVRGTTNATGGGWCDLSGNGNHGELSNGPLFNGSNNVLLNNVTYNTIKDQYGTWLKIFNHNSKNDTVLFANNSEAASTNITIPDADKFSILNQIYKFRRTDGKFKFKLYYPEYPNYTNIWYQTSDPNTELISGYEPINIGYSGNYWGGIEPDQGSSTYIDGSVNHSNWYFSIGQKVGWSGNPGPGVGVNNTSLYICIENTEYNIDTLIFNGSALIPLGKSPTQLGIYDNSYTAECICYPTDLTSDKGMFGGGESALRQGLHLVFRSGGIYFGHYASDYSAGSVSINNWYHIVFRFDKSNGNASIFKNGVLQGTGTISSFIGNGNVLVGGSIGGGSPFVGKIANAKLYNRALSDAEITQNFNATKERFGL